MKDLVRHLWLAALDWEMRGHAVQERTSGIWHKSPGEGWTDCGRWVDGQNVKRVVGPDRHSKSPWGRGRNVTDMKRLCKVCWEDELAVLIPLADVANKKDARRGTAAS